MAVTHTPIFVQTPKVGIGVLAAANTARDGSGSLVTAFTAGTNGSYVKKINFRSSQASAAANSAMVVRVWVALAATPTTWNLKDEAAFAAVTASNTVAGQSVTFNYPDGLLLGAGDLIAVTQSVYAGVQDRNIVVVEGADY